MATDQDVRQGTGSARDLTDEARALQDRGDLAGAAAKYLAAIEAEPSPFRVSRYLHCRRKQSSRIARDTAEFARRAVDDWPGEVWVLREAIWTVYDAFLKGLDTAGAQARLDDSRHALEAARWILGLTREDLPVRLSVFAGARAAKALGRWEEALELLRRLDPATLSDQPQVVNGRRIASDAERWFAMAGRALIELKRFGEASALMGAALDRFPGNESLTRLRALTLLALGNLDDALGLLELLDRHGSPQWYVKWDIARAKARLGRNKEAVLACCEGALLPGDVKGRIGMFEELGGVLQALHLARPALEHLLLAWAIAASEGWEARQERCAERVRGLWTQAPADVDLAGLKMPAGPPAFDAIYRSCRQFWQRQIEEIRPRRRGRIKAFNAERDFGFIEIEGGGDVFFKGRQFRGRAPQVGLMVDFQVKDSYDQKKQRDSQIAVDIRPVALPTTPTQPPALVRKPINIDDLPY